jgi:hypothetical protein
MSINKGFIMKTRSILTTILMASLLAPCCAEAQGNLYVSNLGQTPSSSMTIGSDSWIGQEFLTGTNSGGYGLDAVQLLMNMPSGNPSDLMISIYSLNYESSSPQYGNGLPQYNLGSLGGANPSTGGVFAYSSSGIALLPATYYVVVVTSDTLIAQGAYNWSTGPIGGVSTQGDDGWFIGHLYYVSTDGLTWGSGRDHYLQMAIYATPIPEPETFALFGLGLTCLSLWRLRKAK